MFQVLVNSIRWLSLKLFEINLKNIKLILKFPPICLIIIPIGGIFKSPDIQKTYINKISKKYKKGCLKRANFVHNKR